MDYSGKAVSGAKRLFDGSDLGCTRKERSRVSWAFCAALVVVAVSACDIEKKSEGELPSVDVQVRDKGQLPEYDIEQTQRGRLPDVDVNAESGSMPEFEVETADVEVGTTERSVPVPDVDVNTTQAEVTVPTVDIEMPDGDEEQAATVTEQEERKPTS